MAQSNQPFDPSKPDLEESVNVTEAHATLSRDHAAAAREKTLRENGTEAIPTWVFLLCAVGLIVGGSVLGSRGSFLGYDETVVSGYTTGKPPFGAVEEKVTVGPAMAVYMKAGKKIYAGKCNGCHQSDGAGQAGAIPPLAGSEWIVENTHLAAAALYHGLGGPISVKGVNYNGNMAAQADTLSARDFAALLTYIRNGFGNNVGDIITVEMAQAAIDAGEARGGGQITASELREKYDKMLPGTPLDPETPVNFDDLQPVEGAAK